MIHKMKPVKNIVIYDQFWKYPYGFQDKFNKSLVNLEGDSYIYKLGWRQDIPCEMLPWSIHQLSLPYKILNFLNEIQAKPDDRFIYMDAHCSFGKDFKWEFPEDSVSLIQTTDEKPVYKGYIVIGTVKNVTSLYRNLKGRIDHKKSFEENWLENLINKGIPNTIKLNPLIESEYVSFDNDELKFNYIN